MKIYTKSGDGGKTQIYADEVVRMNKSADVLECYGTLDELNAHIGFLISMQDQESSDSLLSDIQQNLFQIGFAISATSTLKAEDIQALEQEIDKMQDALPPQTSFILPGGCQTGAQAHVCRTVARRAERRMVALMADYPVPENCIQYLNRLSDYFFVFARFFNAAAGIDETKV